MFLSDRVPLAGIRRTTDGYLVAEARVARSGIQLYTGSEVDPENKHGLRDKQVVRVYRPDDEVFDKSAMTSYAYRPITVEHPSEAVTADNWRRLAVGQTGGEVARDGEFVRVPLVLMDSEAIAAVEAGKRELSMGYSTTLDFTAGVTDSGEAYDAVQTSLRMNHLAVVSHARGGSDLRIGDKAKKEVRSMPTRTIIVDGLPVELTDKDAAIVNRALEAAAKRAHDAETALAAAADQAAKDVAARDAELAKRDAQIEELKGKVLDGAALDARVAERAALVSRVRELVPSITVDGKSDADLRRAVVVAKRGEAAVAGKSAAYIDAAFDLLTDSDEIRQAVVSAPVSTHVGDARSLETAAFSKSVTDLNAWRKGA